MDPNPYAPPKARVEGARAIDPGGQSPYDRLYSVSQIFVATFLGTPLAGAWLMGRNYQVLGRPGEAAQTWWTAIGAAVLLMVISYFLPDNFPNSVLPLAAAFGFRAFAENRFGADLKAHGGSGGKLFSWWRAVGVSLLFALAVLVIVFCAMFLFAGAPEIG